MRTRMRPAASPSVMSAAAASASGADGKATKNESPCVSTSTPRWRSTAPRTARRCSPSACAYWSGPSSRRSTVEPSTSVKRNVTVPVGRWARTATSWRSWPTGGDASVQRERPGDDLARRLVGADHDAGAGDRAVHELEPCGNRALGEQALPRADDEWEDPEAVLVGKVVPQERLDQVPAAMHLQLGPVLLFERGDALARVSFD